MERTSCYGSKIWFLKSCRSGEVGRNHDLPSVIYFDNNMMCWKNKGVKYRECMASVSSSMPDKHLPACIMKSGSKEYYCKTGYIQTGITQREVCVSLIFSISPDGRRYRKIE